MFANSSCRTLDRETNRRMVTIICRVVGGGGIKAEDYINIIRLNGP